MAAKWPRQPLPADAGAFPAPVLVLFQQQQLVRDAPLQHRLCHGPTRAGTALHVGCCPTVLGLREEPRPPHVSPSPRQSV